MKKQYNLLYLYCLRFVTLDRLDCVSGLFSSSPCLAAAFFKLGNFLPCFLSPESHIENWGRNYGRCFYGDAKLGVIWKLEAYLWHFYLVQEIPRGPKGSQGSLNSGRVNRKVDQEELH